MKVIHKVNLLLLFCNLFSISRHLLTEPKRKTEIQLGQVTHKLLDMTHSLISSKCYFAYAELRLISLILNSTSVQF